MLTNEDQEKIKLEEIFRDEIRKNLSKNEPNSFGEIFWNFINSSFGIWLLSSVVVGLVALFYNDHKLQNEISANNVATIQKLETEASIRLQQFKSALSRQDPSKIYYEKKDLAYIIDGVLISDGSISSKKPVYVFPEYKERTMNSLLYEIGRLTNNKEQALSIKDARKILVDAQNNLLNMQDPPRLDAFISQRISQMAYTQPENLTPEEQKLLVEYKERENEFKQGSLLTYDNKIKKELSQVQKTLENNEFLKGVSDEISGK